MVAREIGNGEGVVRGGINEICRKRAAHRIQPAVGEFGLKNPRGAGADENPHALRTVLPGCGSHGIRKTILHQPKQGQPVVPAIKFGKIRRQLHGIQPGDFSREGCKIDSIKRARRQSRTLRSQRIKRGPQSPTDAAGRGEM